MNSIFHHVSFARAARQIPAVALLVALSGCAHSVIPRSTPESHVIAAEDLPAGWTAPQVVQAVAPVFPTNLNRGGVEGEVRLMCLINEQGRVRHIAVAAGSDPQFVDSARQALEKWEFTPGSRDGRPVAMSIVVPINFVFDDAVAARKPGAYVAAALPPRS